MLHQLLTSANLTTQQCADVLGISPAVFAEWAAGQRPIPPSYAARLSAVLGVKTEVLLRPGHHRGDAADLTPAIWYKMRGATLAEDDRSLVLIVRQLGHYLNQLEDVTGQKAVGWRGVFEGISRETDVQAPPREQGRQAARMFRESRGLGSLGIGEVLRGNLRSMGILVIESPLPKSRLEGCCFYVGSAPDDRPCLFANTYQSTWFRRNEVLAHELAHAVFDARVEGASLDLSDEALTTSEDGSLAEERAHAFAVELMVPSRVLAHMGHRRGLVWDSLSEADLAWLVAESQVELRSILKSASETGLLSDERAADYMARDISDELKRLSDHALSTEEFIRKQGVASAAWRGKRTTTIPSRKVILPVSYVGAVVEAVGRLDISVGKGAELLMIDASDFETRFAEYVPTSV